jgi:release factor glutamine methyltransferase
MALDVGTGSRCIAVTLAVEQPDLHLVATDLDKKALRTARSNAVQHGVEQRIRFVCTDLASGLSGSYDLICANLPYVPRAALADLAVAQREPRRALDGGVQGLELIRALLMELPPLLAPGGRALLEIDERHGELVLQDARRVLPQAAVRILPDLAGKDRLLVIDRGSRRKS